MSKLFYIGLAALVFLGVGAFVLYSPQVPTGADKEPFVLPPMGERYTNDTHRFSFAVPQGFAMREFEGTVVVENERGEGIQIVITSIDEDIPVLTKERIEADIPDLAVAEPQPVEVGEGRAGLAFKSDNEAFDGASREVWFVFDGQLYQISTYERLDPLLQAIFQTWQFF